MKLIKSESIIHADYETGELKESISSRTHYLPPEPEFIKVYIERINMLYELPKGCPNLIYELASKMDYDGIISIGSATKTKICDRLNIKKQTFDNYIQKLLKKSLIRRVSRGEYELHPNIFAKGQWSQIHNRRRKWTGANIHIFLNSKGKETIKGKLI